MIRVEHIPEFRWIEAIALLSLDVTEPFIPMMGLLVDEKWLWRQGTRNFIKNYRQSFYGSNGSERKSASTILDELRSRGAESSAAWFEWWMRNRFSYETTPRRELFHWEWILRHACENSATWSKLGLSKLVAPEASNRFKELTFSDDYRGLLEQTFVRSLSDWDLHLHAVFLWNDDLPDAPNGPEHLISNIIKEDRGFQFWAWLLSKLSADDQANLLHRAQQYADETEGLKSESRLVHPNIFKSEVPWKPIFE